MRVKVWVVLGSVLGELLVDCDNSGAGTDFDTETGTDTDRPV